MDFYGGGITGVGIQGLALARVALYPLSHSPNLFFALVILQIGSCVFAQDWWQTEILLPMGPWVADWDPPAYCPLGTLEYRLAHHCTTTSGLFVEMWFHSLFCLCWHQTMILPVSASRVAGIIDMRHCVWSVIQFQRQSKYFDSWFFVVQEKTWCMLNKSLFSLIHGSNFSPLFTDSGSLFFFYRFTYLSTLT
jgi:hypothetical protein